MDQELKERLDNLTEMMEDLVVLEMFRTTFSIPDQKGKFPLEWLERLCLLIGYLGQRYGEKYKKRGLVEIAKKMGISKEKLAKIIKDSKYKGR